MPLPELVQAWPAKPAASREALVRRAGKRQLHLTRDTADETGHAVRELLFEATLTNEHIGAEGAEVVSTRRAIAAKPELNPTPL